MLATSDVIAFAATTDLARARVFYEDTLGLPVVDENSYACVFDAHGTMLRVTAVAEVARPGYTVLGWRVADFGETVAGLESGGVVFARYDGMEQDPHGVWTFRPGYPDEVVEEVLAYAGRPVRTALEIGAGTGKATRVFAAHGLAVTATEPDPAMLAELRRHVPPSVTTVEALHWTAPEGRWQRMSALLCSGGVFASFGGQVHLADADLERSVRAARAPYLVDDDVPSPDGTPTDSPLQWPGTELVGSDLFDGVRQTTIPRRMAMSTDDYVAHLSTISAYLELPVGVRDSVLGKIREVLPEAVAVTADLTLHLARRTA